MTSPANEAPIRILVIDDDEEDFIITRDLLAEIEDLSHQVEWANGYASGLRALSATRHDIAFVDYRMGEHTGVELLREVIAAGCQIPLVLLTGQSDYEICVAAGKAGAVDLLIKGQVDAPVLARAARKP